MKKEDLIYMAGFFDADGCVAIGRTKSNSQKYKYDFQIRAIIINCDEVLVQWFQQTTMKGYVYQKNQSKYSLKWKDVYHWTIVGTTAIEFLKEIYPYLKVKKERVGIALQLERNGHFAKYRSEDYYKKQNEIFDTLQKLNKRGKL